MSTDKVRLLLSELEAEVAREALELYVQMRPVPMDDRFEYRYRAARSMLESLRHGNRELGSFIDDERSECRPLHQRIED
jgi:hypothetical protein